MSSSRKLQLVLGAVALGANAFTYAQMAQDPLLARTASVEPNIVFMFDDSGSMAATAIYQFGGGAGGMGRQGPNDDPTNTDRGGINPTWINPPTTLWGRSPDVNLIYYDPRVTYQRRINADGSYQPAGSTSNLSEFNVYFYKPATTTTYRVASVTVSKGGRGYPAQVFASFSNPAAGGTKATATVTMGTTNEVTGVSIANGGSAYTGSERVTFSDAPPGGVTATGTLQFATASNGIVRVNLANNLTHPNAACTTTVLGNRNGGTAAVVTAVRKAGNGNQPIERFIIDNPGSGYTGNITVRVKCGTGNNRDYSTTRGTTRRVTGINITERGSGYLARPVVTIDAPAQGIQATATATIGSTNVVRAITVTNPGSGYIVRPTIQLTGTSPGGGHELTVQTTDVTTGGINARWPGSGPNPKDLTSYFTPGYTPDSASPLARNAEVVPYPNTAKSSVAKFPKFAGRTDCTSQPGYCTWTEEQQNHANWMRYHSTRLELAKTGIGLAFQPLNPTFRLGWGTINDINSNSQLVKGVRLFSGTVRDDFYAWLYGQQAGGGTPNRVALDRVGQYYLRADGNGPWANSPNGDGAISNSGTQAGHATCRRSYAMLMTDGYYNDSFSNYGDYDSTPTGKNQNLPAITEPSSYTYSPIGPYSDTTNSNTKYSNTLADVAARWYLTDLRAGSGNRSLDNRVKSVPGDDAFWQHLNFYAIGLGVTGNLDNENPEVLKSLSGQSPQRTANWPSAPAPDGPGAIDDMWHATVNGRGKMLNAKTSDDLNRAITQMMSDIGGKEGTQAGVAVSTASLTKDTKKYTPSYTPGTWTGNLTAFQLDEDNAVQTGVAWEVEKQVGTNPVTGKKTYQSIIPDHAARNIVVGTGNTSGTRAVPFKYSNMNAAGLMSQMATGSDDNLINYLRGDASNEDNANSSTELYRERLTRLGDIVNSTPVYVKDSVDLKYDKLPDGTTGKDTYRAFVGLKQKRAEGVIFVGANDGMLHAFRDGTFNKDGSVQNVGGIEVFAYVPNALLPALHLLSKKDYTHRYYADGPNSETDAYLAGRGGWTNVVLGSTGGGAGALATAGTSPLSAVFAIDVTSLNSSAESLNASKVMWEASSKQSDFAELGHVLTDIQAGVTRDGRWIAVFGNGYESKSCQARLYIVNLETGARIKEINTNAGSCGADKNGLGGVRLVRNANQQVIGVYAGDLLGNMWKFTLNSTDSNDWRVDLGGEPLYRGQASPRQPITAPPSALKMPILGTGQPSTGYMVVFGTGRFFQTNDELNRDPQQLMGLWDPLEFRKPEDPTTLPAGTLLTAADRATRLQQQTIGAEQRVEGGNTYFAISTNAITYEGAAAKRGWYIALPNAGQRMVYPLDLLAERFSVVDTISPAPPTGDPCINETGGTGYLYIIDAYSGAGPTQPILDTNGDGSVGEGDLVVSGIENKADGRNVTLEVSHDDESITAANVSGGDPGSTLIKIHCSLTNTCKVPEPPIPGGTVKKRQWRQLFPR
jgi:type IV pilus assembly protein PilY1